MPLQSPGKPGVDASGIKGTYRAAVLDDAPEDTDVATVLMMGGVPCYVAMRKFVYLVGADGAITYLTTTDVFSKQSVKP